MAHHLFVLHFFVSYRITCMLFISGRFSWLRGCGQAALPALLAGGAGLSTFPSWVRLSTCVWAPAPAIAGALHRWAGGYGHATEAHRGVVTAVGAVAVDWPSQAAAEVFGGAS